MKFGFRCRRTRGSWDAFSEADVEDGAGVAALRPEALRCDGRAESSSTRTGSEREEPEPTAGSFSPATRPAVPRSALWLRRRLRGSGSPGPGRSRSGAGRLRFRLGSGGAFAGGRLSDRRSAGRGRGVGWRVEGVDGVKGGLGEEGFECRWAEPGPAMPARPALTYLHALPRRARTGASQRASPRQIGRAHV